MSKSQQKLMLWMLCFKSTMNLYPPPEKPDIWGKSNTAFWKFALHYFTLGKDLPVFTNRKKSEKDFLFYEKSVYFLGSYLPGTFEKQEWHHQPSSPRNYTKHQATIALNCVCEHLCFISTYFVHLLASCILSHQKRLRELARVFCLA